MYLYTLTQTHTRATTYMYIYSLICSVILAMLARILTEQILGIFGYYLDASRFVTDFCNNDPAIILVSMILN